MNRRDFSAVMALAITSALAMGATAVLPLWLVTRGPGALSLDHLWFRTRATSTHA